MKKILLLLTVLLCANSIFAQLKFQKTFTATGNDYCYSVHQTADGGFLMAGETDATGDGNYNGYLLRTDASGAILWSHLYGGPDLDWINKAIETSDGNIIVTGGTTDTVNYTSEIWIFKTDALGNVLWQTTSGTSSWDNAFDIKQTPDGGYIVAGYQNAGISSKDDCCLIKMDSSGNIVWTKVYEMNASDDYGYSVELCADGGYIVAGEKYLSSNSHALIIKTDSTGTVEWAKTLGTSGYWINGIVAVGNDFVMAGVVNDPTYRNILITKIASNGDVMWTNAFEGPGAREDNCFNIKQTTDGGFALCGSTNSFTADYQAFLLKTNSTGDILWSNLYGSTGNERVWDFSETSDGGFILGGGTHSFGNADKIFLVKTNSIGISGCNDTAVAFVVNSITPPFFSPTPNSTTVNNTFSSPLTAKLIAFTDSALCLSVNTADLLNETLIEIFPNPAVSELMIKNSGGVLKSIEIFTITGSKIYESDVTMRDGQITVDVSKFHSGIYFVRLESGNQYSIHKVIIE
jgi:hypothetical protein